MKTGKEILEAYNNQDNNLENFITLEEMIDAELTEAKRGQMQAPVGVPSENSFGQWHFTKEELPELDKNVLCYIEVEDIDGDKYRTLCFGKRFINYTQQPVFIADAGSFSHSEYIICWMYVKEIPLPKF